MILRAKYLIVLLNFTLLFPPSVYANSVSWKETKIGSVIGKDGADNGRVQFTLLEDVELKEESQIKIEFCKKDNKCEIIHQISKSKSLEISDKADFSFAEFFALGVISIGTMGIAGMAIIAANATADAGILMPTHAATAMALGIRALDKEAVLTEQAYSLAEYKALIKNALSRYDTGYKDSSNNNDSKEIISSRSEPVKQELPASSEIQNNQTSINAYGN